MVYPDGVFESNSDKYFINNQSATHGIATVTKTNTFRFEHEFVVMAYITLFVLLARCIKRSDFSIYWYIETPD